MTKMNYKHTIFACFIGYICQAIIVNFAPLLFLTFERNYNIAMEQITLLITVNFGVQLLTDVLSSRYVLKFGYRKCIVAAHIFCCTGLILMSLLPEILPSLLGLLISTAIFAVGGGLLEVLVSPIVESCPTKNKTGMMSLMHSFYCWGIVATVLISTAFFVLFGTDNWKILSCLFAIIPFLNIFLLKKVPIYPINGGEKDTLNYKELFCQKTFILLLVMMICSGASEQTVVQWASTFAEKSLSVSKTTGDLLGVCGFSVLMGLARVLYAKFSNKLPIKPAMIISLVLCLISYLMIGLSVSPIIGLTGCIICGFAVGIFWPCTFSLGTISVKSGGTAMFALLALGGDLGCTSGPTFAGFVSAALNNNLKLGILSAIIFPLLLLICLIFLKSKKSN